MSRQIGRPKSNMPKDIMVRVRLDKEYTERLDKCSEKLQISKSEVIRRGIDMVSDSIKK